MRKNRVGYMFLVILSAILLFVFGTPFLLLVFLFWIGFAIVLGILIRRDARHMHLRIKLKTGEQAGRKSMMKLTVETKGLLLASRAVHVELKCHNRMSDSYEVKYLLLRLEERDNQYEVPFLAEQCGEITVRCQAAYVYDLLGLFQIPITSFEEMTTVIYPRRVKLQVEMSRDTYGKPYEEGRIQNRRGNDPSEMFDIREYMPGDDMRSIHWKLSSKVDTLYMREASDPSHYSLVVLLDLGWEHAAKPVPAEMLNAAIAYSYGIMEKLVEQNISFCVAIPTKMGLQLYEIHERRNFRQFFALWFGVPMHKHAGMGFQLFLSEHMEQKFTRLLILTAGEYEQDLKGMDQRIGITVVGTTKEEQMLYTNLGSSLDMVELPENLDLEACYRIRC